MNNQEISINDRNGLTSLTFEHRSTLIKAEDNSKQIELVSTLDRIGKIESHYVVGKPYELHPYKTTFIHSAIDYYNELIR